jgi:hypothetical protein
MIAKYSSMSRRQAIPRFAGRCLGAASIVLWAMTAAAATPVAPDVQSRYEQDRAKCLSGQSNQDQVTCLKEAGAARDAARQGQLNDGDAKYRRNAKERCDALTGDDAKDCLARMKGKGIVSGSAEGGGILRETVTKEVKPVDSAASGAATQ